MSEDPLPNSIMQECSQHWLIEVKGGECCGEGDTSLCQCDWFWFAQAWKYPSIYIQASPVFDGEVFVLRDMIRKCDCQLVLCSFIPL